MTMYSGYVPVECLNIPKILFMDKTLSNLSADAKMLYSLLLDRKKYAALNGWIDEMGTPFVIYPRSEMKKHLNASRHRVDSALAELAGCNQLVLVTQPHPGRACQIYVKDIANNYYESMEEKDMCMMKNGKDELKKDVSTKSFPGVSGIAIISSPEDLEAAIDAFEAMFCKERTEPDSEAEVQDEEDSIDEENENCTGESLYCEEYFQLSKRGRKMNAMRFKGYLSKKDEPDMDTIANDGCDFGAEIGEVLMFMAKKDPEPVSRLFDYLDHLMVKGKRKQVKTSLLTLAMLFDLDKKHLDNLNCCMGEVADEFMADALLSAEIYAADAFKEDEEED